MQPCPRNEHCKGASFGKLFFHVLTKPVRDDILNAERNIELNRIGFLNAPKLTKIIMIGTHSSWYDSYSISLGKDTKIYFSTIQNHSDWEADELGCISGYNWCILGYYWLSNCNYFYNYDGAKNDGYYWSDNYDYGEKITYVPQDPEREGYIFGGWFQEPECVNRWNFETDTLPEAEYDDAGEVIYRETRLYAKWNKIM